MNKKIGPYRVEEQIGVGGMGEVYKAFDDRLDRWVAIKRIRDDKDEGRENRERFQREARATAQLNHSSIVHLYDIFRDGGSDCIVMEFVDGVTLDKLIKNGPLDVVQAASLGHEIASGLAEAHAKGIIHRDLKVENVIVTPEGHAKILDFGLARPLLAGDLDTSLTGKGQLVGTSRAMSPEYVGGEDIDHRSDLFSLGVLLYETVTSHSPFKAHNTLATLKQVMLHRQTPAHVVNSGVPEDFSSVIENLLEKDPEDRPQNAKDVARELGQMSGHLSSGDIARPALTTFSSTPTEVLAPSATAVDIWSGRRWLAIAAVLLVVGIAATYLFTRWWFTSPEDVPIQGMPGNPVVQQKDRIVLADFQNLTGEPLLDDSIALAFRLGLEQSRHAYVLPSSQVQSALSRMERDADTPVDRDIGIEIGQREGARALVVGAIGKVGETYSVTAEVIDPPTGVTTFSTQESASSRDAILAVLESITAAVRVDLGEPQAAIEENRRPLEKVTTANLEALKAYSLGQRRISEDRNEDAIQFLARALELDPEFAMAHAKLAAVHMNLDRDRSTILGHLDQALRRSDRLTEIEKLYVDGWVARLHGDPESVVRAWSLMSTLYPNEFAAHHNLGMAHWSYFQRYQEASRAFRAAIRVAPPEKRSLALTTLAYCQIALGLYEEAQANLESASGQYKDLAMADLHLATRSHVEARSQIDKSVASSSRLQQLHGKLRLAELHASRGSLGQARQTALEAAQLAGDEEPKLGFVAQLALIATLEHTGIEE
ncbi:MAG: protein kinase, partial [bacterium]|nr:protein kinase [bacterium]